MEANSEFPLYFNYPNNLLASKSIQRVHSWHSLEWTLAPTNSLSQPELSFGVHGPLSALDPRC